MLTKLTMNTNIGSVKFSYWFLSSLVKFEFFFAHAHRTYGKTLLKISGTQKILKLLPVRKGP